MIEISACFFIIQVDNSFHMEPPDKQLLSPRKADMGETYCVPGRMENTARLGTGNWAGQP